ncbi:uncharacterized protein I303_100575 [Kwoniella dejecticola CBS 10117]|uniref:Uncharacterized protein n=1 Tax=Kwoniella dejecticola CBS 10117 TaxID=1296121 RepID=A0A1A6AFB3_9TREE|nr:uncharacterized protein I303_00577 [Kwoniella dejecticola CBS 10117]OBR88760.1 hypothetical protein I303_00577 [Kwoniella dejecticola CBS 10117]
MLATRLSWFVVLVSFTLAFSFDRPHLATKDAQPTLPGRDDILTNAERLAQGMLPAMPKGLERKFAIETDKRSADGKNKRQAVCPSARPIAFPPHREDPVDILFQFTANTYESILLPFEARIGNTRSNMLSIGSNGFVQFASGQGATELDDGIPTTTLASTALAVYWDALDYTDNLESVRYAINSTSLTIHYYAQLQEMPNENLIFTIYYDTNSENSSGDSATIGWQDGDQYTLFNYHVHGTIQAFMRLALDTTCPGRYIVS